MENQYRNVFHLEPGKGLLNDPNGLAFYQGKYYVFHQWNRFETNHSYKEWGLFTSTDLLEWTHEGSAILPDRREDSSGVYSGSAIIVNQELRVFYTGNSKEKGQRKSVQLQAISDNGKTFVKGHIATLTPSHFTEHHRDPYVWQAEGKFHMIVGAQDKKGRGCIAYYQSKDSESWQYQGIFFQSDDLDQMAECPNIADMESSQILLVCPQKRDLEQDTDLSSYAGYYIGSVKNGEFFPHTDIQKMDEGFDFYSPQVFRDPRGRQLMWAWMSRMTQEEELTCPTQKDGYLHCLTMPRELKLVNQQLYQLPLEEYMHHRRLVEMITSSEYEIVATSGMDILELTSEKSMDGLKVEIGHQTVWLSYDNQQLTLSRKSWVNDSVQEKTIFLENLRTMQLFIDQSALEIFINQGEKVMSLRYFNSDPKKNYHFKSSNDITIHCYKMEKEKHG
ncbi:glycoside hydrolase family 32 protein [Streptococcus marmotae]|uniref:glycoside hydrolase family 32 protein n=1 Tax=Streptococcus marmotae TaxID=1825069 RepID=UPI0009EDC2E3|nr:glycoside hydrolase family 32 protein [Streptococcus marmotae]